MRPRGKRGPFMNSLSVLSYARSQNVGFCSMFGHILWLHVHVVIVFIPHHTGEGGAGKCGYSEMSSEKVACPLWKSTS